MQYVDLQPDHSNENTKARKPLKQARVEVQPDPENPGYYRGIFRLVPHYQLEGILLLRVSFCKLIEESLTALLRALQSASDVQDISRYVLPCIYWSPS